MTIESAITEPMVIQRIGTNRADRRDRAAELLARSRPETQLPAPLPARILRRPAATHLHRPRPGRRPRVHHLRRIGLLARRLRAGPGAQPAQRAARKARPHVHLHQPRPERREIHGRHDGRHERRQDRRVRPLRKHLRQPARRRTPAASSTPRPKTTSISSANAWPNVASRCSQHSPFPAPVPNRGPDSAPQSSSDEHNPITAQHVPQKVDVASTRSLAFCFVPRTGHEPSSLCDFAKNWRALIIAGRVVGSLSSRSEKSAIPVPSASLSSSHSQPHPPSSRCRLRSSPR